MEKDMILSDLNRKKKQLNDAKNRLKKLEDEYKTIEEFNSQCQAHIRAFDDSVMRRKNKLQRVDVLLNRVKSAKRYKNKMNDLLVGTEFRKASTAISNLEKSISNKKTQIVNNISGTETEISNLEKIVAQLQYSYDTYPEEVDENV